MSGKYTSELENKTYNRKKKTTAKLNKQCFSMNSLELDKVCITDKLWLFFQNSCLPEPGDFKSEPTEAENFCVA